MSDKSKINTGLLYGIVADTMPMEGRDFTIDAVTGQDGKTRLLITPLTDIGKAFTPLLAAKLAKPMGDTGVAVDTGDQMPQEVVTITSIRRKAEEEAAAARLAKIREAEANKQTKMQALTVARDARIAKLGVKAKASQDEVEAQRAVHQASLLEARLKAVNSKIEGIRAEIDAAARNEAEQDEKRGRSWAVDMDAPLTSLFDRQDATSKLVMKERLVAQLATRAVERDELRGQAITLTKQYIIPKK